MTKRSGCDDIKPEGKSKSSIANDSKEDNQQFDLKNSENLENQTVEKRNDSDSIKDIEAETIAEVILFDLNGRILYRGKENIETTNLYQYFSQKEIVPTSGLYFVHVLKKNGERKTTKLFLTK